MKWDEPARTLTQNFIYEASDNKIHPVQNRVLSVYEAMIIQTISKYKYRFRSRGLELSTAKIAEVIRYIKEAIARKPWIKQFWDSADNTKSGYMSNGVVIGQNWDGPAISLKKQLPAVSVHELDVRFDADAVPRVATHGWRSQSQVELWDAVQGFVGHGLKHVLCTDVSRDGALNGPNLDLYAE